MCERFETANRWKLKAPSHGDNYSGLVAGYRKLGSAWSERIRISEILQPQAFLCMVVLQKGSRIGPSTLGFSPMPMHLNDLIVSYRCVRATVVRVIIG